MFSDCCLSCTLVASLKESLLKIQACSLFNGNLSVFIAIVLFSYKCFLFHLLIFFIFFSSFKLKVIKPLDVKTKFYPEVRQVLFQ